MYKGRFFFFFLDSPQSLQSLLSERESRKRQQFPETRFLCRWISWRWVWVKRETLRSSDKSQKDTNVKQKEGSGSRPVPRSSL